jgi:hypothetical protein
MKRMIALLMSAAVSTTAAVTLKDPSATSTHGNDTSTYYSVTQQSSNIGNIFLIIGTLDITGKSIDMVSSSC